MKKFSKKFMASIIAMLLTFTLVSCSAEELILGEWELESQKSSSGQSTNWELQTIKLYEDGTSSVNGEIGTWKIVQDELMILGDYGGRFFYSDSIVGKFSCTGNTLEFSDAQIDGKDNSVNLVYKRVQ